MQNIPKASRLHIGVFGRRNAGKSSLINALTNQNLALVSEIAGTTTDPVYKAMELLPIGPVVMIDTAGIDDVGTLGELRVKKTIEVIRKTDLAVLVLEPEVGIGSYEEELLVKFKDRKIPVVIAMNKSDLIHNNSDELINQVQSETGIRPIMVSAEQKQGIEPLRDEIAKNAPTDYEKDTIIGDLINPGDVVVLVVPIDSAAPKGRLILPQVQTLRDILDHDGIAIVTKETELKETLAKLHEKPKIVVTDSQVFMKVAPLVPEDILLTGFSVLFARYKGDLDLYLDGIKKLEELKPGDKILIAEACTHRRVIDDIGTIKIPKWLRKKVGDDLQFDHVAGREYPSNLSEYDLILHCAGCMLNRKEMLARLHEAKAAGIPVINYGMAIAYLHGICDRALKPFPEIYEKWLD
ncbi:MAG: [FeFe] hydrogenase H-cluster maturation GTPase HydF [Halanaerobiales bacterium]|nr:[FeFe] hydrogenase H-cluster maturation GTPase HydF [Halanaerobiales bacterium]